MRHELEIERLEGRVTELVALAAGEEVTTEMVPCNHPSWREVGDWTPAHPLTQTVTRKECTTCGQMVTRTKCTVCGHKVTHIQTLVPL